jgi:uroporphyrinogen-III synthase
VIGRTPGSLRLGADEEKGRALGLLSCVPSVVAMKAVAMAGGRPQVAVVADRRRAEQAALLERAGFEVVAFPLLRTEGEGSGSLRSATEHLIEAPPDYLVANTGYGMRTWFELASRWGLLAPLTAALATKTLIAARGAKALGELRKAGLNAWYKARSETLQEVGERLLREELAAKTVALQLHGDDEGGKGISLRLSEQGALVMPVPIYRMSTAGTEVATALAQAVVNREVAAVTFTAAPQVEALFQAADSLGQRGELLAAFNSGAVVAACIGEVCAAAARAEGISRTFVPEHPRLGSLASGLASYLLGPEPTCRGW